MTSLTLRLPDETYRRLDEIARARGTSVDRLFDDMAALMVAESDAKAHFDARAARGTGQGRAGVGTVAQGRRDGGEE